MEEARRKIKGERTGEYTNKDVRGHFIAMSGEFVGTILFLWFAFAATQIAVNEQTADPLVRLLFISMAFGFSLATTAWVFYRVSGGLFNPAVSSYTFQSSPTQGSALLILAGHGGHDACRCITTGSRSTLDPNPAPGQHGRCRSRQLHVPRPTRVCHEFDSRNFHCSRSLHRNVPDRRTRTHDLIFGCREAESDLCRASRHWIGPFCG